MSRYQNLKYEEIGEILGCEVGAVKLRVFRAVRALGQVYAGLAGESVMNCERAAAQFADGLLNRVESFELQAHLRDCAACRDEYGAVRRTWEAMDLIPSEDPSPFVRDRFYQTLDAYRHGAAHRNPTRISKLFGWCSRRPVAQFAAGMAILAAGAGIGHYATVRNHDRQQMAALQGEVSSMRQLVALSLLQQQSANDRLQGVSWAYQVERNDTEVLGALLETVNHDANVNVRLAAVDALRNFIESPVARKSISQALNQQSDPLVQVALLDLLSEFGGGQAMGAVKTFLAKEDLDGGVRMRAGKLLTKFQ